MRGWVGLVLMLSAIPVLAACMGAPQWTKSGATNRQAYNDLSECRQVAGKAIKRDIDIDTDIMSTREHDWKNDSTIDMHRNSDEHSDRERSADIVAGCMESKGYAPAE